MAPLPRSRILQQFFSPVGRNVSPAGGNVVMKGSLISFNYAFWKNDAYPLVVVSESNRDAGKLWGVNVHYLTFPYIRKLLELSTGNPAFSYKSISADGYLSGAYRSYKWNGIRQVKVLDYKFLLNVMTMVRTFDPAEVQIIRRQVQEQMRQQINPKATNLSQGGEQLPTGG
jgi:hypothetical protein